MLVFVMVCTACTDPVKPPDLTPQLEHLGNPFLEKPPFARNVWDMKVFDGRVYFGHGDAVANSGPIKLFSYNPTEGSFKSALTVDDEEIHEFDMIDNQLVIPGYDPLEPWDLGNFYRLENGLWNKHRTIPWGVHTYQMATFHGALFVTIGTDFKHPGLLSSSDNGLTWTDVSDKGLELRRFKRLFVLDDQLYAAGNLGDGMVKLENNLFVNAQIPLISIVPGLSSRSAIMIDQLEPFQNGVIFTAGNIQAYTSDPAEQRFELKSEGVFYTTNFSDTIRIPLPSNSIPMDLVARAGKVYLLTTQQTTNGFENTLLESNDLLSWSEILHFSTASLARSFEVLDGKFYFGLGCFFSLQACEANGEILRFTP